MLNHDQFSPRTWHVHSPTGPVRLCRPHFRSSKSLLPKFNQVEFSCDIDPEPSHWAALSIEKDWFPRAAQPNPNFALGSKIFSTGRAATSPARYAPWFAGILKLKYEQDAQFSFLWLWGNLIFSHYRGRRKVVKQLSEDAGRTYWRGLKDNNSLTFLLNSKVRFNRYNPGRINPERTENQSELIIFFCGFVTLFTNTKFVALIVELSLSSSKK